PTWEEPCHGHLCLGQSRSLLHRRAGASKSRINSPPENCSTARNPTRTKSFRHLVHKRRIQRTRLRAPPIKRETKQTLCHQPRRPSPRWTILAFGTTSCSSIRGGKDRLQIPTERSARAKILPLSFCRIAQGTCTFLTEGPGESGKYCFPRYNC